MSLGLGCWGISEWQHGMCPDFCWSLSTHQRTQLCAAQCVISLVSSDPFCESRSQMSSAAVV